MTSWKFLVKDSIFLCCIQRFVNHNCLIVTLRGKCVVGNKQIRFTNLWILLKEILSLTQNFPPKHAYIILARSLKYFPTAQSWNIWKQNMRQILCFWKLWKMSELWESPLLVSVILVLFCVAGNFQNISNRRLFSVSGRLNWNEFKIGLKQIWNFGNCNGKIYFILNWKDEPNFGLKTSSLGFLSALIEIWAGQVGFESYSGKGL